MSESSPKMPAVQHDLQESLRWVVCPVCHASLAADEAAIQCRGCHRRYPVVDGLPVLLADRAIHSA